MLLRSDLFLRRITITTATQFDFRFNRPKKPVYISNLHKMGTDESKNKGVEPRKPSQSTTAIIAKAENDLKEKEKEKEEAEKKSVANPLPPEKPLPGDCCGSGCVRCVWDVYYEELEEYNRLYNRDDSKTS